MDISTAITGGGTSYPMAAYSDGSKIASETTGSYIYAGTYQ
jgi:hypothetical protein